MTARRPGAPRRAGRPASSSRSGGADRAAGAPRPASAPRRRRTAGAVAEEEEPRVWGITRRALVLVALIVIAMATLVPTINRYVTQRQQLAAAQEQVSQQQKDVQELQADVARWDDPTFVAAQARERLLFAMPGESQYRLTDTSGKDVPATEAETAQSTAAKGEWFDTMWTSVEGSSRLRPEDIPDTATTTSGETQPAAPSSPAPSASHDQEPPA